jgi:hypothetical protein
MVKGALTMLLALACLLLGGCLDDVLGVLLEPASVVGDAANQVAASAVQTLASVPSELTDTAQALQDVDRLIQNSGDPDAQARLATLRDQLIANQNASEGGTQLADFAHRDPTGGFRRPIDGMSSVLIPNMLASLTISLPHSLTRRPVPRPDVLAQNCSLQRVDAPAFMLSVKPIRLGQ